MPKLLFQTYDKIMEKDKLHILIKKMLSYTKALLKERPKL